MVYSVLDTKVGTFAQPFFQMTDAAMIRSFSDAVNDERRGEMWYKHPEDFSLYQVGVFDDQTGELMPVQLRNVVTASALASGRLDVGPSVSPGVLKEVVN